MFPNVAERMIALNQNIFKNVVDAAIMMRKFNLNYSTHWVNYLETMVQEYVSHEIKIIYMLKLNGDN